MATIKDVAALAGISYTTVSHVVNGTRKVSAATVLAVQRAIQDLGYIPNTLCGDVDAADVLVLFPQPVQAGSVIRCRPIAVLKMTDEAGEDAKVLAVPVDKVLSIYSHWQKPEDLNELRLRQIQHFFEHYKDLEKGKWVKIEGWHGPEAAKEEILAGVANYQKDAAK